jgi:hypothetical protein
MAILAGRLAGGVKWKKREGEKIYYRRSFDFMRRVSRLLFPLFLCTVSVMAVHAQTARNIRVDLKEVFSLGLFFTDNN